MGFHMYKIFKQFLEGKKAYEEIQHKETSSY